MSDTDKDYEIKLNFPSAELLVTYTGCHLCPFDSLVCHKASKQVQVPSAKKAVISGVNSD